MILDAIPPSSSWLMITMSILSMVSMPAFVMCFIAGARKRTTAAVFLTIVTSLLIGSWAGGTNTDQLEAFEEETVSHFNDAYGYQLTDENVDELRYADGSDVVMHVMTEEGNVREVLFRGLDGVVVPFANDTNGEWARAAAAGS